MNNSSELIADSLVSYLTEAQIKGKTKYEIFNEWSRINNFDFGGTHINSWCLNCIQLFINGIDRNLLSSILKSQ